MDAHRTTVGLMADPGVPAAAAAAIADGLRHGLIEREDEAAWHVECSRETLPLTPDGDIVLLDKASELRRRYGWHHLVYLTDLPRYHGKDPLLCEVSHHYRASLVSIPTLGAARLHPQVEQLVAALVRSVEGAATQSSLVESIRSTPGFTRARGAGEGPDDITHVVLTGWSSRVRLLSGMVRSNRPGSMLPALSGSLTAAAAAGAFGVYYSSIGALADALHPARMLLVAAVVVVLFTGWLIFRNGLWNTRREVESPHPFGPDPVDLVAAATDARGELLSDEIAAVELLNLVRPLVAVAYFADLRHDPDADSSPGGVGPQVRVARAAR